ncbi:MULTISPECIES: MFS transporter [Providencia]|uniref:MFS transporter n=4 Tax=Providencia TaxID=586 RepID=A0AAI9HY62_PROST|nr:MULTISPECIES: MFS transporter [Providencia]ELR5046061.1 MFS transporter [Providencia rettgeri]ELR5035060.1 MFS transporter [Providencia stuartii]ELR5122896.1 MFS transporter [Providencia stuartii]ELR5293202.1 MFS transporter [Providencia stuartii]MCR4181647.1 MFS transporter [Providencia vermicola]
MSESVGSIKSQKMPLSTWKIYLAPIIGGIFIPMMFLWAPLITLQMDKELGFSPEKVGFIYMIEILTGMLANVLAFFWLKTKINWYHIYIVMILLVSVLNIASGFFIKDNFNLYIGIRILVAIFGSTIFIITNSCMALLPNAYRAFSISLFSQIVLGSLGLFILPIFLDTYGIISAYIFISILLVCVLPLTKGIDSIWRMKEEKIFKEKTQGVASKSVFKSEMYFCLFAIFLFNVVIAGVWTFIGGYLKAINVELSTIYNILGSASMIGILGAGTSILFSKKVNLVFVTSFIFLIAAVLAMYLNVNTLFVIVSCYVFKYIWTLILPFTMSIAAEYEVDGNVMNLTSLTLGLGIALGPMMSGMLIERVSFSSMFLLNLILLVISMVIIVKIIFKNNKYKG